MNNKKLRFLLGLIVAVLVLSILSGIYSFILSALYTMVAVIFAVTAITAMKTAAVAAKTAITGELVTKERETTVAGRAVAVGIMFIGIGVGALAIFAAVEMGTIGIFAIPVLTALYLYNIEKEKTIVNQNSCEIIENNEIPSNKLLVSEVKEVCCKIVNSVLTDVDEKLLCGLGNDVYKCYDNRRSDIQQYYNPRSATTPIH